MPDIAIKGIYHDGKILPREEIPFKQDMNVIIVFTGKHDPDEARYYEDGWRAAEEQASEEYKTGKVKSAGSLEDMFDAIEKKTDAD